MRYCLFVILTMLGVFGASAAALQMRLGERPLTTGSERFFAPFALTGFDKTGLKIQSFRFCFKGISPDCVTTAGLVASANVPFSDTLTRFPYEPNIATGTLQVKGETLTVTLSEPFALPNQIIPDCFLLPVLQLRRIPDGEFDVGIESVTFSNGDTLPLSGTVKVRNVSAPLQLKVDAVRADGGTRITVSADKPLAYPPLIQPIYGAAYPLRDYHAWGNREKTLRRTMQPDGNGGYFYFHPDLALLTGNGRSDRAVDYQLQPAPDTWKWRADNSGRDLTDGDARGGWHVTGAVQWMHDGEYTITFDLRQPQAVRRVVVYAESRQHLTMETADAATGPWRRAEAEHLPAQPPQIRFVSEKYLDFEAIEFLLPKAETARFVRLTGRGSKPTVSEVEIWGEATPAIPAAGFRIFAADIAGNPATARIDAPAGN